MGIQSSVNSMLNSALAAAYVGNDAFKWNERRTLKKASANLESKSNPWAMEKQTEIQNELFKLTGNNKYKTKAFEYAENAKRIRDNNLKQELFENQMKENEREDIRVEDGVEISRTPLVNLQEKARLEAVRRYEDTIRTRAEQQEGLRARLKVLGMLLPEDKEYEEAKPWALD